MVVPQKVKDATSPNLVMVYWLLTEFGWDYYSIDFNLQLMLNFAELDVLLRIRIQQFIKLNIIITKIKNFYLFNQPFSFTKLFIVRIRVIYKIKKQMSLFNIKFSIYCQTNFGEVVFICGNAAELGNWNPQNAMRLYTDARLYPKWDPYRTIQVRQGNKLLFKLCIVNQDRVVRWQNISENREIIANQNLVVEFSAHLDQITLSQMTEQAIRPPRKKTFDILNQLESDGSSSKQYWKQFMEQQQESILYITLTTQMRKIVEYQNDFLQNYQQLDLHRCSSQFDKNLSTKIQKTNQIIHKTSNFYCILQNTDNDQLISVLGQDSYLVKFSQFSTYSIHNNQVPIFFHIQSLKQGQQNQSCFQVFQNIQRILHAENILLSQNQKKIQYYISLKLHWDPSKQLIQKFIQKRVAVILIQSQRILQILLEIIAGLNLQYYTQDYTQITVFLKNISIMKVKLLVENQISFKYQTQSKKQKAQHENKYFDWVKKLVLHESNKSYVGFSKNNFIQSIKEDDTYISLLYHRKNIMIINAQKIEDFPNKLLTQIISLSSKPNFQIFIIIEKVTQQIKAKFPVSKNNKIVVIGKNGTIYANQQNFIDIYVSLNLQKMKFSSQMTNIYQSIKLGLDQKRNLGNQILLNFKKGHVGRIGLDMLKTKIKQHNQLSLHKLILRQSQGTKISIKPFCLTDEFFLKSILQNMAKHIHEDRALVLALNMKNDNNFMHKINTIFHKTFKFKNNIKMRNSQIISNNQIEYSGIAKQQVITLNILEALLEFMCEHFLAGSHIKSYNLNLLSPKKGRRSFVQKLHVHQYSSQNF